MKQNKRKLAWLKVRQTAKDAGGEAWAAWRKAHPFPPRVPKAPDYDQQKVALPITVQPPIPVPETQAERWKRERLARQKLPLDVVDTCP